MNLSARLCFCCSAGVVHLILCCCCCYFFRLVDVVAGAGAVGIFAVAVSLHLIN